MCVSLYSQEGTDKPDGAVRNLFRNLIRLDSSLLPPDVANKRIANRYKKSLKVGKEELDGRLSNDTVICIPTRSSQTVASRFVCCACVVVS